MDNFVGALRDLVALLAEFSDAATDGALRLDGAKFVESAGNGKFDPLAAKWWATLVAVAELVEAQDAPLSGGQRAYLDRLLFGGMGSLNDFSLDEERLGEDARLVNSRMNDLRQSLFAAFNNFD